MSDLAWISEEFLAPDAGAVALILLGAILGSSILADTIARRTAIPRISLLVIVGLVVAAIQQLVLGQEGGRPLRDLAEPLIQLALVMVAFLLGGQLTLRRLRQLGPLILVLSLTVMGVGALVVGGGLLLLGFPLVLALTLAAISVATDPAAVEEILAEGRPRSRAARVLTGVVAIDDAWGILAFGLAMAFLGWFLAGDGSGALLHAGWELAGAVLLGLVVGLPAAWLTGRLEPGKPTQAEALALVLLIAGLSMWLGVSALLAAMIAGFLVINLSLHHKRSFNEIEHIEWPFLVFFFVLSGASVDLLALGSVLWLTLAYVALRLVGRYLGGVVGWRLAGRRAKGVPRGIGLALTPQAGVAIGMALLAAERFPEQAGLIVSTVVTSTLVFELIGPWMLRRVVYRD
ncbi:cation:proton antiporter [Thioalkalivibrio sp. ALMg3]|uniref:cation:proton antiporter n=1 Tax=Thioalkalivibrio sp. ALMg3 TaxID=1158163 RepID=UPI00037CBA9C|nr:cation:proton antiporter [Thioalkalivibrio sp. ALMg3]